jgi:hypothetical protein
VAEVVGSAEPVTHDDPVAGWTLPTSAFMRRIVCGP